MFKNLKYIKLYDILSIFIFLLLIIPSLFYRLYLRITGRRVWLITEDGHTARDNGYYFYKYMREEQKSFESYYVIDKKSHDYEKVAKLGNIIKFRSIRHWIYYLSCEYNISSQKNGNPAQALFYVLHVKFNLFNNRVFLQHGIIMNDNNYVHYSETKFKYFICGAKKEYEYVKSHFGYPEGSVLFTGLARHDYLTKDVAVKNNQILIMPTWRSWLGRETNRLSKQEIFTETEYYKNWNGLLNDKSFIDYIEKNDLKVKFCPHINMRRFLDDFNPGSKNIEIVSPDEDIQTLLKQSAIMITDYTSASMDFALLKKPIVYFQFDQKEYREKQYKTGYFDYEKDGFGPVVKTIEKTVKSIKDLHQNEHFVAKKEFTGKSASFFELNRNGVNSNSKAIANALLKGKLRENRVGLIDLFLLMLYFCYIFMFNIYGYFDSSILVGSFLIVFFIVSKPYREHIFKSINKRHLTKIAVATLAIVGWSIFTMIFNRSCDKSLLLNFAKILLTVGIGYLLYSYTMYCGRGSRVLSYVISAFIVQSVFECIFYLSPNISGYFSYLRGEAATRTAARFNGSRGIAITKTPFFTLSIAYGTITMIYLSFYNTLFNKRPLLKVAGMLLILVGGLFAGRAGFVALLFAPFMLRKEGIKNGIKAVTVGTIIGTILMCLAIVGIGHLTSKTPQAQTLNEYVTEAASNVASGKGVKTASTNKLIRMFKRSFDQHALLVGDARFSSDDGGYYAGTDVGYYRKVFFGGILMVVLFIIWHLCLLGDIAFKKEFLLLTLFFLVMEIKGVVIGQNTMIYAIITPLVFFCTHHQKSTKNHRLEK